MNEIVVNTLATIAWPHSLQLLRDARGWGIAAASVSWQMARWMLRTAQVAGLELDVLAATAGPL